MSISNLKNSIKIFEYASMELEKISDNGLKKLSKIRKPDNVIHLKHLNNDNELGINTLLATQRIPSIVLLGLAVELSLKLIILQQTKKEYKIHALNKLFLKLPTDFQKQIISNVISELHITENVFNDKLRENDLVFVNWRYFHENQTPNYAGIEFLRCFINYLNDKII